MNNNTIPDQKDFETEEEYFKACREHRKMLNNKTAEEAADSFTSSEFFEWFNTQAFQREQGEQEYTLVYEIDLPKILNDFLKHKKIKTSDNGN